MMKRINIVLKRYGRIYLHLFAFTLKYLFEYRFNFFVRSLHALMYVGILFLVLQSLFFHTTDLGGWTKDEVILLFAMVHFVYGFYMFFFMKGLEHLMQYQVVSGDLDLLLTKPVNLQFLTAFGKPNVDAISFWLAMSLLMARQLVRLSPQLTLANTALFIAVTLACTVISYCIIASWATVSFYVTRAQQVVYFIEKVTDFSQYPTHIFSKGLQLFAFTVIPIAYLAYVPISFLLGRATPWIVASVVVMLPLTICINKFAWQRALKSYSSASS